jgi:hypothetical protein
MHNDSRVRARAAWLGVVATVLAWTAGAGEPSGTQASPWRS